MSDIVKILPYSIDLDQTIGKTELHTLFVMSESLAHRFEIEIRSGGKAADLTGCTVTGFFTNFKEKTMITVSGKAEDNKAIVTLNKPCYTLHGQFVLIIQVKSGDVETAVFHGEGFMRTSKAEKIVFDDYVVYDVDTLLSQISAMKTATEAANTATGKANTATTNANKATTNANNAASAANTAAAAANAAAQDWSNGTAANASKLGGLLPSEYVQVANGRETLGIKAKKLCETAVYALDAEVPLSDNPLTFDYLIGRVNYYSGSISIPYGSPSTFDISAITATSNDLSSGLLIQHTRLVHVSGTNNLQLISHRHFKLNYGGTITPCTETEAASARIGPIWGIKLIK